MTEKLLATLIGLIVVTFGVVALSLALYGYQYQLVRANDLEKQAAYYAKNFGLCKEILDHGKIELRWEQ